MKIGKEGVIGLSQGLNDLDEENKESVKWNFTLQCNSIDGGQLLAIPVQDFRAMIANKPERREIFEKIALDEENKI